ncbi:MAG: hypothetical protein ACTSR3_05670 [Candidatus Helarchaeota archaeon]
MSKLSNLIGKSKIFKIGEVELELKPLKFEHVDLLGELDDESKRVGAMKKIIALTLKEAVPDATDEEIEQIAFGHIVEVTKATKN